MAKRKKKFQFQFICYLNRRMNSEKGIFSKSRTDIPIIYMHVNINYCNYSYNKNIWSIIWILVIIQNLLQQAATIFFFENDNIVGNQCWKSNSMSQNPEVLFVLNINFNPFLEISLLLSYIRNSSGVFISFIFLLLDLLKPETAWKLSENG